MRSVYLLMSISLLLSSACGSSGGSEGPVKANAPDGTIYVTDFIDAGMRVVHPDGSTERFEF